VSEFETGAMSLEEYLDVTVFYTPRLFSREDFELYMLALSEPNPFTIEIAKHVASAGRVRLMTMNNESEVLNVYRIDRFGLKAIFPTFLSSCWLGVRKPQRAFFQRGLGIAQAHPESSLLVDDRDQNLAPAAALGMHTIRYTNPESLARELAQYSARIPYYNARYLVAPGLMGWAQLKHDRHPHHGTDVAETKEKLSYDLYYLSKRSLFIDLYIILQTIRVVLTAKGS